MVSAWQNDSEFDLKFIIYPQLKRYCGPIFIGKSLKSADGTVVANGGYGLIQTGQKKLLVTCDHVVKEFEETKHREKAAFLGVCLDRGKPVVLSFNLLLCRNSNLDLATFDLETMLQFCEGREFYDLSKSPPPKVRTGESLVFQGYPGEKRTGDSEGLKFGRMTFRVSVADASRQTIIADVSKVKRISAEPNQEWEDPYGGCSGTPVFVYHPDRTPRLVGFTTEYGLKMVRFIHASCIKPDGFIYDAT